jgi:hypothetical protein
MKFKSSQKKMLAGALVLIMVCAVSCKKYLEVEPLSYFGEEITFDNPVNAQKAVLGAYNQLTGDNGYGIRVSMYYPLDDDIMMGQGGTPYPDNERRDIAHYNVTPGNTQLFSPYAQMYKGIEYANLCIYNIPKMDQYTNGAPQDQKDLKRLYGEALTLRALFYTELIRNWGDVTAQFLPSSRTPNLYMGKTDRDTIYNHLLDDLALAETLMPWRSEVASDERFTQGSARGLRARIALYRGGYSLRKNRQMERGSNYLFYYKIAMDECAAIMARPQDHKLNPSYQALWKDNVDAHKIDPNGEVLMEVAMAGGSSATGDSKLGYYNGPRYNSVGNGALTILPSYFYMFDSTDARRDVTCAAYNINVGNTYTGRTGGTIVDGKYRRDWITPSVLTSAAQYFGVNWIIMRYSDVLLMYAEASNEINNGPTPEAKAAYEAVRKRSYPLNDPLIGITPTTKTAFFDAVVKERALELGGEGIRKYDLIRWNMLASKIAETKATLLAQSTRTGAPWNTYPANMYYNKLVTTGLVWAGSYYKPSVTPTPATATFTSVSWLGSSITTALLPYYAIAFVPNHSELLPLPQAAIDANSPALTQDYGY